MENTTRRALLAAGGAATIGTVAIADRNTSATNSEQNESDPMPQQNETAPESEPQPTEGGPNLVRVTHLAPDVGEITVAANGARGFEAVELLEESEYTTYQANADYDISILENGDELAHETTVSLSSGPVTLTLVGEQCRQSDRPLELLTLADDYSAAESGMARMQTVHASPDAPTFDIRTESGDQLVSGLSFAESTVSDVPVGEYVIGVYTSEDDDPLFRFEMEFEEGVSYTTYAAGYVEPTNAPSAVPDDFSFILAISGGTEPTTQ